MFIAQYIAHSLKTIDVVAREWENELENHRKFKIKYDNLETNMNHVVNEGEILIKIILWSIEGLGGEIVVGATGCGVVVEFVRDFNACFRIGMLGAKWDRVHPCLSRMGRILLYWCSLRRSGTGKNGPIW